MIFSRTIGNAAPSTKPQSRLKTGLFASVLTIALSGCVSTAPKLGGSSDNLISGSAGGANAQGQNTALESCDAPLGTMSLFEDKTLPWWNRYFSDYPQLGSTLPVLRLMIQQSNCFVVVERGKAFEAINRERELANSGELRESSNFGQGQLVSADYTASPSVQFSKKGTGGIGGAVVGSLLGSVGSALAGSLKSNEAATTILLIDNRSGVQVSAATGSAKNFDFRLFGGLFKGGFAGAGGFSNTPEGKIVTAAFVDSYNQMVKSLRNYKTQEVEGGLGTGGQLKVQ